MPGWTLVDTHPTRGRTFQRPLGVYELNFFLDGLFNGTSDSLQHLQLRLSNGDARLLSAANIERAWLSTKRRYPLAGATVHGASDPLRLGDSVAGGDDATSGPRFVVREHDLSVLGPREIVFGQVSSAEEALQRATAILDGPPPLSKDLLAQLYVFYETDDADVVHLMTLIAHCVTDGAANKAFVRCLLDTLARGPDAEPAQPPLEDRLAMAVPLSELEPALVRSLSPARRRWRRAIGTVMHQLMMAKRRGGHTLPCRLTRSTQQTPARSGYVSTTLTPTESATVIANCRAHGITFGNALIALAQAAMTRVLYRRYLRGEISEEEWAYRKRQPHVTGGPLNLRSYLDEAWFGKGGGAEFVVSMSLFFYQLPFMTLGGPAAERRGRDRERVLSDGAPPFADLLTFARFLHRTSLVKKQATAFFRHPLFLEIVHGTGTSRFARRRRDALQWTESAKAADGTREKSDVDEVLSITDMPLVWAHGGSSSGNMDLVSPSEYPLPPAHPLSPYAAAPHPLRAGYVTPPATAPSDATPTIVVEFARTRLHTRPSELYLGAATLRGQLTLHVFYDGNVYEDGVVQEWVDEAKEAALWYLGQTHR